MLADDKLNRSQQGALAVMRTVLVLAGKELVFFLVADTVLWFGFNMRIMLITQ